MSQTVTAAFVTQFETEVHTAYQRMGSKFRNMTRTKGGVKNKTTFQKVGAGIASERGQRHGMIPVMSIDHTSVTCTTADYFAADWCDQKDLMRLDIDERGVINNAGAMALGRRQDDLIITNGLDPTTNVTTEAGSAGLVDSTTRTKVETVYQTFGDNNVPDDGERYWSVSPAAWLDLMGHPQFSNADYVGADQLPFAGGMSAKRWMTFMFFEFSGLPKTAAIRKTFAWHKNAVGSCYGEDVSSDITWEGTRAAWFINNSMQMGACLIDVNGVYEVQIAE